MDSHSHLLKRQTTAGSAGSRVLTPLENVGNVVANAAASASIGSIAQTITDTINATIPTTANNQTAAAAAPAAGQSAVPQSVTPSRAAPSVTLNASLRTQPSIASGAISGRALILMNINSVFLIAIAMILIDRNIMKQ